MKSHQKSSSQPLLDNWLEFIARQHRFVFQRPINRVQQILMKPPMKTTVEPVAIKTEQADLPVNTTIKEANSLFEQPWWLDAVAPNAWSAVEVSKEGQVVARLPYVIKKKMGLTTLTMPPLNQTLGPWLMPSTAKYANQVAQQKELLTSLIKQLPHHDHFSLNLHYSITNWLPFYWQGFTQTTRYAYVIEGLKELDRVWADFRRNVRTDIRKAQKQVTVRSDLGIERFLEIHALTYQRQGLQLPYSSEFVQRLDAACAEQQARRMFFAEDAAGKIHAALYIVWDENAAYALMSGGDPELRDSGANSLLYWEAFQFAATVCNSFNFQGSMVEPIEFFLRGFGGRQLPYFHITRMNRRMKVVTAGRDVLGSFSKFAK